MLSTFTIGKRQREATPVEWPPRAQCPHPALLHLAAGKGTEQLLETVWMLR